MRSSPASFGALAVALVTTAGSAASPPAGPLPPPEDLDLARALFKEMIEIKTTHDVGSTALARAIEEHLLRAGFAESDVTFIAPPEHPSKGNVVVRYRGKGRARPVLFLGHLDVVEAQAQDWTFDPFIFSEKDGFFYGRGTIDMKSGDAALLEALIRLKRERFTPERDIIAAFTADEEAGGDANGPAFLLKNHRELIDAELAVNLDGGGGNYKEGKRLYFSLGTSEKTYVTYTAETTSPGGHGSLPGPDNAIYRLAAGLGRLSAYKFPVMLTATTRANLAALADLDPSAQSADMRALAEDATDTAAAERLSETVRLNAQLRTTCVATLISGGHAENALPQRARATIQCRMMPGDTAEHVQAALTEALGDPQIALTLDAPPIVSPESPPTDAIMRKAAGVIHSMWPGVPIVPTMATGFSDGRQTRNAGIPTYDLGGIWSDIDENRAHGRDERVGVREFDESVEYTYRLVKAMSAK
ncbi:MAG TPA: M20/M25/M40 family metallo-hydrolase [Steroidobacteraceae bacterium]|jgi:acetylornithine deacetylase/succinyl-diaminopimelate desuccinylase-like protein|nr:M20/M25/M40 family metallo-hydrolase [Steroidobacteraceae bacterium]